MRKPAKTKGPAGQTGNEMMIQASCHKASSASLALVAASMALIALSGAAQAQNTGFYVRGDLGVAFSTQANTQDDNCGGGAPFFGCGTTLDSSAGTSLAFTIGGGYHFTPWFRGDATIGYRPLFGVDGTIVRPGSANRPFEADVSSVAGMVNGYLDIAGLVQGGTGILQPYVMAGIGFAHNDMGDVASTHPTTNAAQTSPGGGNIAFAWTLGVGTGVDVGKGFVLDFGYKYLDLGDFKSDAGNACAGGTCRYVDSVTGGLTVHEFSAGVRYNF